MQGWSLIDCPMREEAKGHSEDLTQTVWISARKVNCTTQNKNYVQWILAMRAHGLISFLTGILRFYKEASNASSETISKELYKSSKSSSSLREKWILWAVRENKLTTLDYLYRKQDGGCFDHVTDEKGRSLLFVAMESKSEEMVHYLCQVIFCILILLFLLPVYS